MKLPVSQSAFCYALIRSAVVGDEMPGWGEPDQTPPCQPNDAFTPFSTRAQPDVTATKPRIPTN